MKNLKTLGKTLNKNDQGKIFGGRPDLGDNECYLVYDPLICGGLPVCYLCVPV